MTIKKIAKSRIYQRNNGIILSLFLILPVLIIVNTSLEFFCVSETNDRFIPISNDTAFVLSLAIFIASNGIILPLILSERKLMRYERIFKISVFVTQIIIVFLLVALFLQMVFFSYYMISILYTIVYIASFMSIGILVISFIKLYSWYNIKRQIVILLYAAIMILMSILTIISMLYLSQNLEFQTSSIIYNDVSHTSCSIMFSGNRPTNPYNIIIFAGKNVNLGLLYNTTLMAAYFLTWLTTVLILKEYAKRIGKVKYLLLILPLLFFFFRYIDYSTDLLLYLKLNSLVPTLNSLLEILKSSVLGILIEYSLLFGSLFFSAVFLGIYLKLPNQYKLRNSVLLTALGMFLLFSSRELVGLFLSSYPPLGIMTISFMGLSSYLFFYGIFETARLISRNTDVKNKIFANIGSNRSFLERISSAENEQIILGMVKSASKHANDVTEKTDSLDENELRLLVKDIIQELQSEKEQRTKRKK